MARFLVTIATPKSVKQVECNTYEQVLDLFSKEYIDTPFSRTFFQFSVHKGAI